MFQPHYVVTEFDDVEEIKRIFREFSNQVKLKEDISVYVASNNDELTIIPKDPNIFFPQFKSKIGYSDDDNITTRDGYRVLSQYKTFKINNNKIILRSHVKLEDLLNNNADYSGNGSTPRPTNSGVEPELNKSTKEHKYQPHKPKKYIEEAEDMTEHIPYDFPEENIEEKEPMTKFDFINILAESSNNGYEDELPEYINGNEIGDFEHLIDDDLYLGDIKWGDDYVEEGDLYISEKASYHEQIKLHKILDEELNNITSEEEFYSLFSQPYENNEWDI